jgi:hypothetical protein
MSKTCSPQRAQRTQRKGERKPQADILPDDVYWPEDEFVEDEQ